ncbi:MULTISPECIES: hypothetical protein [unclassified Microcoleus]|uniref:hypothetical protein n=1 Tax=unclassified Microcoleus TaxID=2642155 RepID=UPI002FD40472
MVPAGRLYDIQALPIKVNQLALAIYIVGHSPKLTSISYLERIIEKYQAMNVNIDKLRERNELITRLESLLRDVNEGKKLDPADILAATKTIEKYLDRADYKPITGDNYYRYHNLGTGQFIQQVNTERYQYIIRDYGKNYRRGTGSEVNSVIRWVRSCSTNLESRFGHKGAEISEIREYLEKSFSDRFPTNNLQLAVYERGQKFLEIYYKGELEIKQEIAIVAPQTDKKESMLTTTETNFKPEWATVLEIQQFLQCSEIKETPLINSTQLQIERMVRKYIRSNYLTLTGKNNVFKETKISSIVGYDSSHKGYGQIVKTFLKYVRPYLDPSSSNVLKGELINLDNLRTYNEQNARDLMGAMTNNWKHWKHKDAETITLGESIFNKPDPGVLMLAVTAVIHKNPHHDKIIWRDLIDVFYQLSEHSLGFRASNGCVLTPHSFYDSGVIRHTHRIKLQLIDLLLKEQRKKQNKAQNNLKQATTNEEKQKAMEEIELISPGSIEAWLQSPIDKLYSNLRKLDSQWEINLANHDILTHLQEMEKALELAIKAEQTF